MADITTQTLARTPVSLPGAGQTVTVKLTAGMLIAYQFDTSDATFASNGKDLVLTTANGGTIVFEGFLDLAETDELPVFELLGGEQVPGDVYLFAFNLTDDAESETAANSALSGSGIGVYVDDDGNLYRSLDSLRAMDDPDRGGINPFTADDIRDSLAIPSSNPPTISGHLSFEVNEDGFNASTGEDTPLIIFDTDILALVNDPDPNSVVAVTGLNVSGGTLVKIAAGVWSFTPDQDFAGDVQVTFTVSDGTYTVGGTGTIEVLPINDAPVAGVEEAAVVEDGSITGSVAEYVTDVDTDAEGLSYTLDDGQTIPVGLTFNADGTWSFDASSYDSLADGETETFNLTYIVSDGDLSDTGTLTITVTGTNDGPVVDAPSTAAVLEDATFNGSVAGDVTDVDTAAADLTYALTEGQTVPTGLTFREDGSYTFDASSYDNLAEGETLTYSLTYDVTDDGNLSDTGTLTITVTGANDPADITIGVGDSATGSVTEDAVLNILTETGSLTVSDVDAGQDAFDVNRVDSAEGNLGSLSITSDGTWTYTIDNTLDAVQELGLNQSFTETFRVWSADGTDSQLITVTVNGANDPADITIGVGDSATGSVTEDAVLNILTETGSLTVSDVDAGQDAFDVNRVDSAEGNLGSLSITSDGTWTYTIDNTLDAVQELGLNQSFTETFRVWSADGTDSQLITVTVNGANDPADITIGVGDSATGSVTEDAVMNILTETGSLTVSDVDAGQDAFDVNRVDSAEGNLGSLSITSDGTWTYTIDNTLDAVQELGLNQSFTESFRVWSADGTDSQLITVSVNGANDPADITIGVGDSATGSVTEDAVMNILTETGSLTVSDVDAGQDAFDVNRVDSAEGNLGSLSITSDGTWTYTIDNTLDAVQELGLDQSFTETFRVWSAERTPS